MGRFCGRVFHCWSVTVDSINVIVWFHIVVLVLR